MRMGHEGQRRNLEESGFNEGDETGSKIWKSRIQLEAETGADGQVDHSDLGTAGRKKGVRSRWRRTTLPNAHLRMQAPRWSAFNRADT